MKTVEALDGRELNVGTDYTISWEQNYIAVPGATVDVFDIADAKSGEHFRVSLAALGHMTAGATSKFVIVDTLIAPEVTIDVTEPFDTSSANYAADVDNAVIIDGSHVADDVTISVTVEGNSVRPTGSVKLSYLLSDNTSVEFATIELGAPDSTAANAHIGVASYTTNQLPKGIMRITAKYVGDSVYTAGQDNHNAYKVWSIAISNDVNDYGEVTIAATRDADNAIVGTGEQLIANEN